MRCQSLIPGPALLGFMEAYDGAYGDHRTPQPYPRVSPASVSGILLPFACPHCGKVCPEAVDPIRRRDYADQERRFSWCPECRKRYVVDFQGAPLAEPLPAGAVSAPARVERGGEPVRPVGELEALGAVAV